MNFNRKIIAAALISSIISLVNCSKTTETVSDSTTETTSAVSTTVISEIEDTLKYKVTDPFTYKVGKPEILDNSDTIKTVYFYRDSKKIFGQLYLPSNKGDHPLVIISSGQAASYKIYTDEAKSFADNGIACLIFDFTGSGELFTFTSGVQKSLSYGDGTQITVLTEVADLNAIIDSLPDFPDIDEENVFLFGHSLGGLSSTYIGCSRSDDIKGMMLIEPSYAYPDYSRETSPDLSKVPDVITDTSLYNVEVGKQFVVDMQSVEIYDKMPDYDKDVLILLGTEKDSLGATNREYFDRAAKTFPCAEVTEIDGADHYFQGEYGEKAMEQFIKFVQEHI